MTTPTEAPDWTRDPDILENIVIAALEQRDWQGLDYSLRMLAVADPRRADQIVTVMKAGIYLSRERRAAGDQS